MKKTNYLALIEELSETTGYGKSVVRDIMDAFLDKIHSLENVGDSIVLKGLGKFEIRHRRKKRAKLNGKNMTIDERKTLYFEVFKRYTQEGR